MSKRQIHWQAPVTVVLALGAGALFAVGHHLFYASLQGTAVRNQDVDLLGTLVSSQQINITAGNVFAFLVNFSLGTALATAYTQLVFKNLINRKATVATWDAAYGGLGNVFYLVKVWIWWQFPLMCGLVIVGWLLPLASTIPPGTLSVGIAPVDSSPVLAQVPAVDFVSLNYVADMLRPPQGESSEFNTRFEYQGPSQEVTRIAGSVAQTGSIAQINSPSPNATWTLSFDGPGLSCTDVPQATQSEVRSRLINALSTSAGCTAQGFLAWKDTNAGYPLPGNTSISFSQLNNGGLALNIVGLPHMMDLVPGTLSGLGVGAQLEACQSQTYPIADRFVEASMVQCQLRNMTYHVSFEYENGEQDITIKTETISDDPLHPFSFVAGNGQSRPDNVINNIDCSVLSGVLDVDPDANPDQICLIDTRILKTLSYQAIFQAFKDLIVGSVSRPDVVAAPDTSTNVANTVLVNTPQLDYLNPALKTYSSIGEKPLQEYVQTGNIALYQGLVNTARTNLTGSLIPTIEALFQNITVSMMSSRTLQPNLTSAYAPAPVRVTLRNVHNVYEYSAARLWLSYGIAIGVTALTSAIGLWAIYANGASYSQDFSTVLRIGKGAHIEPQIREEDMDGRDALPKYLEKAEILLRPSKSATSPPTLKTKDEPDQSRGGSEDVMSPNTQERVVGGSSTSS